MKKYYVYPAVDIINFKSRDLLMLSANSGYFGENVDFNEFI
ncbi:MAG: hypothetical protein ACI3XQ_08385 [Eubacteriales bacterium]